MRGRRPNVETNAATAALYADRVLQANEGCDFDFLRGRSEVVSRRAHVPVERPADGLRVRRLVPLDRPLTQNESSWRTSSAGRSCARAGGSRHARPSRRPGEPPTRSKGLSWAAWWLDDAETVFAAREQAYRLYRQGGDAAGAARMATWLAADELDFHGAEAVASGWLQRAHRLLDGLEPGPEHGWLAFHEGYIAHAGGDGAAARGARRPGGRARPALRRPRPRDARARARGGVARRRSDVSRRACAVSTRRRRRRSRARPRFRSRAPGRAACSSARAPPSSTSTAPAEWCDRIAEFADRYGSRYMLGFCRAEYGAVHLWRGRWSEAESLFEESHRGTTPSPGRRTCRGRWPRSPSCGAGRGGPTRPRHCSTRRARTTSAQLCRARLALDGGAAARRGRAARAAADATCRHRSARPRSSCSRVR